MQLFYVPIVWDELPEKPETPFYFKLLTDKPPVCHSCGKSLERGKTALLRDTAKYPNWKESELHAWKEQILTKKDTESVRELRGITLICPVCFSTGKGINVSGFAHHRVLIG